jgi:hypothetical protein
VSTNLLLTRPRSVRCCPLSSDQGFRLGRLVLDTNGASRCQKKGPSLALEEALAAVDDSNARAIELTRRLAAIIAEIDEIKRQMPTERERASPSRPLSEPLGNSTD